MERNKFMSQSNHLHQANTVFEAKFAKFLEDYPTYKQTTDLDKLRQEEYSRLDEQDHIYLDYTGGGLYADSQLREHMRMLRENIFGNPHSHNPSSMAMTELVVQTRSAVLDFFNTTEDDYVVVFTPNASGALKLVGESYPFTANSHFALCADDHNSVNGIREFARARGAKVSYSPLISPELRMDLHRLDTILASADPNANNLFAFPAQSNYSGVKHPLTLIERARDKGWDVLVDAAAFAPTNQFDIGRWQPDFAAFSFYKMFGYPTGIGALLVRRQILPKLRRPWFAGGTVKIVSVKALDHYLADGEAAFEDGTINYLGIPAIEIGLRHLNKIGMITIGERVRCLTGWLLNELSTLRHTNGQPIILVHGPTDLEMRGGTITMSFFGSDKRPISGQIVEQLAAQANISLRTGCFCNPGSGEAAFQLPESLMKSFFTNEEGINFSELVEIINKAQGIDVSAVRISVGLASNFADVYRFIQFAAGFRDQTVDQYQSISTSPESALRDAA
jgi:selenocysteine lyase/cysteine desulfurase